MIKILTTFKRISEDLKDMKFEDETDEGEEELLEGSERDHGFKIEFPLDEEQLKKLIELYRRRRVSKLKRFK